MYSTSQYIILNKQNINVTYSIKDHNQFNCPDFLV